MFMEPSALPSLILTMGTRLVMAIAVATIVLVAADLVWSRLFWARDLRMTRQEQKDEMKQVEGDPLVKARLRSLARDRARKRMIAAVPKATFVITNPTHYAIALRYVKEEGGAPLVIAKGQDLIALKIREIATAALDPDHRGQAAGPVALQGGRGGQDDSAGILQGGGRDRILPVPAPQRRTSVAG